VSTPLVVIGDTLLDRELEGGVERLCPDAPVPVLDERRVRSRPGGAALAARLAVADGYDVTLVTALSADRAGRGLAAALERAGIEVVDLGLAGATPEKIRVTTDGRPLLRVDRGGGGVVGGVTAAARAAIGWAGAVLVSDYGRGVAADPGVRQALLARKERVPVVWDPHPRGPSPLPGVSLATPNEREAARFEPAPSGDGFEARVARALRLCRRWRAHALCVTCGDRGALLVREREGPVLVPAVPASGSDACGAGDRFASAAVGVLAGGATVEDAVIIAVANAADFVASATAAALYRDWSGGTRGQRAAGGNVAEEVIARTRAAGGTVVATGGCFDLLHVGHVRTLEAARALGDCLVVCLNSDVSVRRLKGTGRPVVPQDEREAVLLALGCVDAVVAFDEDTPELLLARLRPDVWAKGGDYLAHELPERHVVEGFGGRCVALPYLAGRSTTTLIREAGARAR